MEARVSEYFISEELLKRCTLPEWMTAEDIARMGLVQVEGLPGVYFRPVAGPPVELAEDEFLAPGDGSRCYMRIEDGRLHVSATRGGHSCSSWSKSQLTCNAASDTDPNTWPRALAYFDRHVAKHPLDSMARTFADEPDALLVAPEPARVADVRWTGSEVNFALANVTRYYAGKWNTEEFKARLHPSDIALIERCWAEGRLGEREVLADDGTTYRLFWEAAPSGNQYPKMANDSESMTLAGPLGPDFRVADRITDTNERDRIKRFVEEGPPKEPAPVTPSGEVKAPEDLASMWETTAMCEGARREQAERERDEARDREIQHLARAERAEAALSDHIRRGEGDMNAPKFAGGAWEVASVSVERTERDPLVELVSPLLAELRKMMPPAPDLTELREALAYRDSIALGVSLDSADLRIEAAARKLCAVERLVK